MGPALEARGPTGHAYRSEEAGDRPDEATVWSGRTAVQGTVEVSVVDIARVAPRNDRADRIAGARGARYGCDGVVLQAVGAWAPVDVIVA